MLVLDLQRFAGEKTERATPKRRNEVRKEGNIPKSPELTSAVGFVAAVVAIRLFGPFIWRFFEAQFVNGLTHAVTKPLTQQAVSRLGVGFLLDLVKLVLPIVGIAGAVGILVAYAQVGQVFLPNMLIPRFSKILPSEGFKRLFSARALVEASKSLFKLAIVGGVTYASVGGIMRQVALDSDFSIVSVPGLIGAIAFRLALEIAALMVGLAVADAVWQRFEYERGIRMSKQDIKDEHKQEEGDPKIKSNIRKRGYALAFRRMMQAVPEADVVVTNPTHFAVALQYAAGKMVAPVVVAKGQDELARRIKQVAADAGVPLVENRPLAHALYENVEIGQPVPKDLYAAVAEVLAHVYRLKQAGMRG